MARQGAGRLSRCRLLIVAGGMADQTGFNQSGENALPGLRGRLVKRNDRGQKLDGDGKQRKKPRRTTETARIVVIAFQVGEQTEGQGTPPVGAPT